MADMVRTTEVATEVISLTPESVTRFSHIALEVIVSRFITDTFTSSAAAAATITGSLIHTGSLAANCSATAAINGQYIPSFTGWGIPISL